MIRPLLSAGVLSCCLWTAVIPDALAQGAGQPLPPEEALLAATFQAIISGPEDTAVGRTVVLNASLSRTLDQQVQYEWYVNDERSSISKTVEAVYTPEEPGPITFRLVMRATIDGERRESTATHVVTAYNRKIVLVAGSDIPADKIALHTQSAADAGIYMPVIQPPAATVSLGTEAAITASLAERTGTLAGAEAIVLWTDGIAGLQSLMRVMQSDPELLAGVRNQSIVLIAGRNLKTLARVARGPYGVLRPQQILITRKEAINPLLATPNLQDFAAEVAQRDIDALVIDASTAGIRPWNVLSTLVNAMLTRGISSDAMLLVLALPIIATILAFLKQVVGITTFGLYTPSIVALSFLALGWPVGVLFLLCILAAGYAARAFMRRWRLLYIPKVAIILTVVSVAVLLLLGIATMLGMTISRDTIFILLIMSTLAESFLNLKTEEGWNAAIWGVIETILASMVCVFLVQWTLFQSMLIAYPEFLLLTLPVNVIVGRWTGLRLVEYFRFREVFKHLQEE